MTEAVLRSGYIIKKAIRAPKVQLSKGNSPITDFSRPIKDSAVYQYNKALPLQNSQKFLTVKSFGASAFPVFTGLVIGLTCIGLSQVIFKDSFNKNNAIEISYNDYAERFKVNEPLKATRKSLEISKINQIETALNEAISNQQSVPEVVLPVSYNPSSNRMFEGERTDVTQIGSLQRGNYSGASAVERKVYDIIKKFTKNQEAGMKLAGRIVAESRKSRYDPLFVAAVIKSESGFNTFATSIVGAKGLMQIMPNTGRYVEKLKDYGPRPAGFLTDPQYNLKLGIGYLKHLEEMYDGNKVLTLMAYNWGPGKVNNTVSGKNRGVPKEVMNYALKILHDHNSWRKEMFVEG